MTNPLLRLLPVIAIALIVAACQKTADGMAGINGTSVLSGTGSPSAATGSEGDFYLDTSTQILYGPKKGNDWGTGVLLKGNANVMIDTFRIQGTAWQSGAMYYVGSSASVSTGFESRSFDHTEPPLTQQLLNTGFVQAFYTSEPDLNANNWTPLPYSFITYGGYQYNYATETNVGKISFYFYFNKITADPPDLQNYQMPDLRFKIVMIPGNVVTGMIGKKETISTVPGN